MCFAGVLLGCRNEGDARRVTTAGNEPVTLQLNWIPDAQHGGFYEASLGGFFAEEGLEVELLPGGPGTAVLPKVALGRCDFAIANADQVLLARAQGADVVAVFAAMQDSPRCIMVHTSSGIESLDQLRDLSLALGNGKAFAEYMKLKLPLEGVRIVSYSGSVAKFLVDPNFAQQGYVFSEPLVAASQGGDPKALMVSSLGFNPYSSVVVTRRALWQSDPELVRRVVRAVRAGWQAYLNDPERTNQALQEVNSEMSTEILSQAVDQIRPLCLAGNVPLGSMELARFETLRSQLVELKLLAPDSPPAVTAFVPMQAP